MSSLREQSVPVSWRSILVGLLLVPLNTYWIAMTEMVWTSLHFTVSSLPMNVIFILLFLVLINWLAKLVLPNSALSPSELLTIYIILAASSNISGYDGMVALMGVIPHAFWYNTLRMIGLPCFTKIFLIGLLSATGRSSGASIAAKSLSSQRQT